MITFIKNGNIFESKCEAWCNPVNCISVMGAGLALAFKLKFPKMFKEYRRVCKEGKLRPGIIHVWENTNEHPKYVINFPTKDDLSPSELVYISSGLLTLINTIEEKGIKSVALPGLGVGLGGLPWLDVKTLIDKFAEKLPDLIIEAYEPH
jgi:O-acetyl-ADP-ribose deacetylase (regulator of RNase III)